MLQGSLLSWRVVEEQASELIVFNFVDPSSPKDRFGHLSGRHPMLDNGGAMTQTMSLMR